MIGRAALVGTVLGASVVSGASAQTVPFYEGFDNALENVWNSFPFPNQDFNDFPFVVYEGFPTLGYQSADGALVLRLNHTFDESIRYIGMSPAQVFYDDLGVVEARIRTYDIDTVNIESPIALRLVSPGGPKITVGLFGVTNFWYGSTIDDFLTIGGFNMQEYTWYRLRFLNKNGELKAQLLTDAGQLVWSHTFSHDLEDMVNAGGGPDLYLEVVQTMYLLDNEMNPSPINCGIDWIEVRLPCAPDLNDDGSLDFADVSLFLTAFSDGDLSVDFDGSGSVDFGDVSAFLTLYTAGCP